MLSIVIENGRVYLYVDGKFIVSMPMGEWSYAIAHPKIGRSNAA